MTMVSRSTQMECMPKAKTMSTISLVSMAMADTQTRIGPPCKTNNTKISTDNTKTNTVIMVQAEEAFTAGVVEAEAAG